MSDTKVKKDNSELFKWDGKPDVYKRQGRTVVVVHGYDYVVAVFFYIRKGADLFQAALPCLAEGHAAVKRYRAGIGNRAAAG